VGCGCKAGEAIGDRVQSATAATAAAAGQAQKVVQDNTATTATAVDQAKKVLGDAGEAAQQAWSQAGGVAEEYLSLSELKGRRIIRFRRKRLYGLSVVKWSRRKAAQRVHRAELLRERPRASSLSGLAPLICSKGVLAGR
jgi:hypothetical protein